jgi:hypothetical protein
VTLQVPITPSIWSCLLAQKKFSEEEKDLSVFSGLEAANFTTIATIVWIAKKDCSQEVSLSGLDLGSGGGDRLLVLVVKILILLDPNQFSLVEHKNGKTDPYVL